MLACILLCLSTDNAKLHAWGFGLKVYNCKTKCETQNKQFSKSHLACKSVRSAFGLTENQVPGTQLGLQIACVSKSISHIEFQCVFCTPCAQKLARDPQARTVYTLCWLVQCLLGEVESRFGFRV